MNTYIAFYKGEQLTVTADDASKARIVAARLLGTKLYNISVFEISNYESEYADMLL